MKITEYPEEILASWISRKVGRAVKWTETRSEHMSSSIHGRDQIDYVKVGAKRDGTITGLECTAIADCGAFYTMLTPFISAFTGFVISGLLQDPEPEVHRQGRRSPTRCATDATRGAGRPEATHLIEVMVEQLAHELGMDPLELRRKNFIPKEDFPAEVAVGIVYDSGDYHGSLDKLLTHVDLDAFRREQEELRAKGIHRGIGFSTWMEICGLAPSRVVGPMGVGLQAGFYESSLVRVHATGRGDRLLAAPRRTARAWTRRSRRSSPTGSGSRPTWSTSSTATPAPARSASAPTARARWPSAASRSPARP